MFHRLMPTADTFRTWIIRGVYLALVAMIVTGLTVGERAWSDDEPAAASEAPAETEDAANTADNEVLSNDQDALAIQYDRFEKTLRELSEYMKSSDPGRADLLIRAFGQSKKNQVALQMHELVNLLNQEQLGDALERQTLLVEHLNGLLDLLQSEDRRSEIEEEKKRIQDLLKDVGKLISKEKTIRSKTERGDNMQRLADGQEQVAKDAEKLVDKIDRQDAEKNEKARAAKQSSSDQDSEGGKSGKSSDGEGESQGKGKDGEPKEGEQKDADDSEEGDSSKPSDDEGENDSKDKKDGDKKDGKEGDPKDKKDSKNKKDGENKDGEPSEGEGDSEGEPSEGSPSEGSPSEGSPSEGSPSEGSPSQGQPSQGQPGQSGSPSSSQQQQQQQQTPGRDEIEQARQEMEKAIKELEEQARDKASGHQDEALRKLAEAKAKLEEILRQLREEERELFLKDLEARFQRMLALQTAVYTGTVALSKSASEEQSERHLSRSVKLARDEDVIVMEAEKALALLRDDGTSVAFPEAVELMRDDMLLVVRRLNRAQTDSLTITYEEDIIAALKEMIEALQKELEKAQEQQQQQQDQQSQPQDPSLVDKIAELKMLRSLQLRINRRTKDLGQLSPEEQATDPEIIGQLQQLSRRQSRLQQATHDIVTGKNK